MPLLEPMITQVTYAYVRHQSSMCWYNGNHNGQNWNEHNIHVVAATGFFNNDNLGASKDPASDHKVGFMTTRDFIFILFIFSFFGWDGWVGVGWGVGGGYNL